MGERWHTREDSGIRLDAEGRFWHDGEPIENANVARAFHKGLAREADGRWVIRFGWDWAYITLEDAPLQVRALRAEGAGFVLALDDETEVHVAPSAFRLAESGVLYARVRGGWEARLSRAAQAQLAPFLDDAEGRIGLRTPERFVPLEAR